MPDTCTARADGVDALSRAREAQDSVQRDPVHAERLARAVLADDGAPAAARVLAHLALGRVLHETGQIDEACHVYADGVAHAVATAQPLDEARLRMSWALCLQAAGDARGALEQLDLAEPRLSGTERGRVLVQRGFVLMHMGQGAPAIAAYDQARRLLAAGGDRLALARLHGNRGIAATQLGRLAAAEADFLLAQSIAEELGQDLLAAGALHNLGYLYGRSGRVPEALQHLERARDAYAALGSPGRLVAALDADHCELLLASGLAAEAVVSADRLVDAATAAGNALHLAEAHLLRARGLLLQGFNRRAREEADVAAGMFRAHRRRPWAALAGYVGVQAEVRASEHEARPPGRLLARARASAAALAASGWTVEAAHVRTYVGRIALAQGRHDVATRELAAAAAARRRGTASLRAEAWHATALLRLAGGDETGARRAIVAGLRVVDRHRAGLGATELRAHASGHGVELARLGVRLARRTGDATDLLRWAERWRAGTLALPASRSGDEQLTRDLADLRRLHGEVRAATLAGDDAKATLARVTQLEAAVTGRARLAPGDPRSVAATLDVGSLRAHLHDRTLVELVEVDDELGALVVDRRRTRHVALGSLRRAVATHEHLRFALRRLTVLPAGHRRAGAARHALDVAARELDDQLLAPLGLGDGAVVVVPTGELHAVAWSALPTLAGRPTTVAPSAAWWMRGGPPLSRGRVLVVEGPDLVHAGPEVAAVVAAHRRSRLLAGADATVGAVLGALGDADLAHVAAHGTFRADNPLFSFLRLHDGPLYVHDLDGLPRPPATFVLTACDAGRSGVLAGDELLGTATALLGAGVQTVVAPVLPVPDAAAAAFAVDLHAALARAASPAHALARAAAVARSSDDPAALAVAASFQCVGTAASDSRIADVAARVSGRCESPPTPTPPTAGGAPRERRQPAVHGRPPRG